MKINKIRDFIFEKYFKRIRLPKKDLLFRKTSRKKDLQLFEIKLIEKLLDPCNDK